MNQRLRDYAALLGDLLEYPTEDPKTLAAAICCALLERGGAEFDAIDSALLELADQIQELSLEELHREHVAMFDLRPECSLQMAWHIYGDTPRQGRALAALTEIYKDAGFMLSSKQLPDYLPLMLEFLSVAPAWACLAVSQGFMGQIEALAERISAGKSVYGPLGRALAALAGAAGRLAAREETAGRQKAPSASGRPVFEKSLSEAQGSFDTPTDNS